MSDHLNSIRAKSSINENALKEARKRSFARLNCTPTTSLLTEDITTEKVDLNDRQALVVKYRIKARKLSRSILRKWHARLDIEEVDSIVDLSLCEAVKRFDPDKGASFMTFMYFHLRGNLIRAVTGAVQDQALPQHDEMEVTGYAAECDNSATSVAQQRAPKIADIVEAFYSEERDMPEEMLYSKELNLVFQKVLSGLDELEREVINRLYFLEEQLVDIVERLGYSRCHISRVKKRALAILYAELSVALPHIQHSASGESSSKEWDNGFSDDEDREDGKKKYEYNSSTTCRLNKAPLHKFGLRNCNVDATRPIRRRRPRAGHARSRLLERISA